MRTRREYLAAFVSLFLSFAILFANVVLHTRRINFEVYEVWSRLLFSTWIVAGIEFVRILLSRRRTRLILSLEIIVFFCTLAALAAVVEIDNPDRSLVWFTVFHYGSPSLADVLKLALLIPACRRRNVDALVLLPILCVSFLDDFWTGCRSALDQLHFPIHLWNLPSVPVGSYVLTFDDFDSLFLPTGILLFLVLRAVRIARERARVGAEIEAAQTMQQLLLARSSEPTPGFDVESVYLPASEVGGDFFLVSPDPHHGSLTAIVGDVSGKGLSAAMRVSMILGILRREDSRELATILYRLNHALYSQGGEGFTTACCIQLHGDGSYRVANAGHISPYVNGDEVETCPGLPLGLVTDQEYEERSGQLATGAQIVLMSDGVVEARGKKGELYGFDRLQALTLRPAQEIAATAQAFGQDDDITVLTLACTG